MTVQRPIPDYVAAREAMVDGQLRPAGVNDPLVVEAMARVPREQFVTDSNRPLAYSDRSVPIGDGRVLAPPVATGLLLNAMALQPGQRALVVASGTGYSAAVLGAIGLDVTAIEGSAKLAAVAEGLGVRTVNADPELGHAGASPYDIILIDGAVDYVPEAIVGQLADGGKIGFPSLDRGVSRLTVGRKAGGALGLRAIADSAVAPLPGFIRPRAFTF